MKKILVLSTIIIILLFSLCTKGYDPDITSEELLEKIHFLAGDSLKGRYPGTPEDTLLLNYISSQFRQYGLELFDEDGIQDFTFTASITSGNNNSLIIGQKFFIFGSDFTPLNFSSSDSISATVAFAGYGFDILADTFTRNDYRDINPQGKWVIILRGNPENNNQHTFYSDFEGDYNKAMLAKDKGAAGVILVSGTEFDPSDNFPDQKTEQAYLGIPCIQIKRDVADFLFASIKMTTAEIEKKLAGQGKIFSFDLDQKICARTDIIHNKTQTGNVIAFLKGSDPQVCDQYIVIGAHHDHLGTGGKPGSYRKSDSISIYYGADDNASGVATVLELAEKFSILEPERSILFVTFGAEEKGIIGSKYFTENSPVPLKNIIMMINIDMVGRMKTDSTLQIGGVGTSPEFEQIIKQLNSQYKFNLRLTPAGYGPSDHASFYTKDKPVLFFTTGVHTDYHTPEDKIDSINTDALVDITSYIGDVALYIADYDSVPRFTEAGPKNPETRGFRGKITLGIMPDVSAGEKKGVPVLGVTEGRPAQMGGIRKGDIIVGINSKPIGDIYEYMFRLNQLKAGDAVIVTIKRNNEIIDLLIQL